MMGMTLPVVCQRVTMPVTVVKTSSCYSQIPRINRQPVSKCLPLTLTQKDTSLRVVTLGVEQVEHC